VLDEPHPLALETDLPEVETRGTTARQGGRRPPPPEERRPVETRPGRVQSACPTGLHLDRDQDLAREEDEVELGRGRDQAAGEEPPAPPPQGALHGALARPGEERVEGREARQRPARGEPGAEAQPGRGPAPRPAARAPRGPA
jgi:hypothetical protein